MKKLSALIVDDESAGRTVLEFFLNTYAAHIFGDIRTCSSVIDAVNHIEAKSPDLLFVDIEMQGELGLDLSRKFPAIPTVVVSAHPQYAIDAIRSGVIDFLTKPLEDSVFIAFVERLQERFKSNLSKPNQESLIIRDGGNSVIILIDDIQYIEASGAYSKIHTTHRSFLVSKTLKVLTPMLPDHFYRLHRSYLVPNEQIESFKGNSVSLKSGAQIGLSKSGRKLLLEKFGS